MELMTLWSLGGQHHSVMYKNSVITRRETSMKILSCIVVTCIISVHHIIRKWTYYFQLHKINNLHRHVICIRCLSERLDNRIQNFFDFIYIAIEILTGDLQQNTVGDDCGFLSITNLAKKREEKKINKYAKGKIRDNSVQKSPIFSFFFFFVSFFACFHLSQ